MLVCRQDLRNRHPEAMPCDTKRKRLKGIANMKAAVVHEFGKPLSIENVPVPEPGEGQILVKIIACGVCHTDIHAADGDWPVKPKLPFIPGHEGRAYVASFV